MYNLSFSPDCTRHTRLQVLNRKIHLYHSATSSQNSQKFLFFNDYKFTASKFVMKMNEEPRLNVVLVPETVCDCYILLSQFCECSGVLELSFCCCYEDARSKVL